MNEVPIEGNSLDRSDGSVESGDVEALLRNIESMDKTSSSMKLPASSENFKSLIRLFLSEKRVDRKIYVLKWWAENSVEKPLFFEIAKITLAVPPTHRLVFEAKSWRKYEGDIQ